MGDSSFVHLTDLHFADPAGASWLGLDTGQRLRQVLEAIRSMAIQPLCFVVSGDLVNGASAANYEMLRSGLDALDRFGVPVILALGNHDDRLLFRQIILAQEGGDPGAPYCATHSIGPLRFIVLDSKGGTGGPIEVDEEQLHFLNAELETAAAATLLVLHHPPLPTAVGDLRARLGNRERLAEIIQGRVSAVLCGHVHFSNVGCFAGAVCAAAPAVASLLDPSTRVGHRHLDGSGFNLVHLQEGDLVINPVLLPGAQSEIARS